MECVGISTFNIKLSFIRTCLNFWPIYLHSKIINETNSCSTLSRGSRDFVALCAVALVYFFIQKVSQGV